MGTDCKYCGAYVPAGMDVCQACGKKVKRDKAEAGSFSQNPASAAGAYAYQEQVVNERKEEDSTYHYSYANSQGGDPATGTQAYSTAGTQVNGMDEDAAKNRSLCYLCYIGPLFIIPYLINRDSDFVKFHSNQGFILFVLSALLNFIGFGVVGTVIQLIGLAFGCRSVHAGEKKLLPLLDRLGDWRILK